MKKNLLIMLMASAMIATLFTACGSSEEATVEAPATTTVELTSEDKLEVAETAPAAAENVRGYVFSVDGVELYADADMDSILPSMKEPKSTFEAPSCAGQGTAYTYDFGSYEVETYPSDSGQNLIGYITLKDDLVATAEGIELYMSKDDVIAAYGDNYTETDQGLTYEKNDSKICFVITDDEVTSIMYISPAMG